MNSTEPGNNGRVIAGAFVLIAAFGCTEALLFQLGGLLPALAVPVLALTWWCGYRLVTVPAAPGTGGNTVEPGTTARREPPRADQPHTW